MVRLMPFALCVPGFGSVEAGTTYEHKEALQTLSKDKGAI